MESLGIGDEEAARRWLRDKGAAEPRLDRATSTKELNQLAADLAVNRGAHMSARDLATHLDMPVERVVDVLRTHGVAVRDVDAVLFTDADLAMAELSRRTGITDTPDGRALSRVIATALDGIADAAVALYVQGDEEEILRQGLGSLALVQKTSHMIDLAGQLGAGMGVLFRHHLRQAIHRQRVTQASVTSPDLARVAVGFVDLVGSTAFGQSADVAALRKLVSEFEDRAFEVAAAQGGRVVKFIGDEIMVAALDPESGCRLMLALVEACCTGGMQPRGGLSYGEVLFRGGDYYGPEVNLASRLVDTAIPGEVLVSGSVVEVVTGDQASGAGEPGDAGVGGVGGVGGGAGSLRFEPAGRRLLKGFAAPIPVWSVSTEERLGG